VGERRGATGRTRARFVSTGDAAGNRVGLRIIVSRVVFEPLSQRRIIDLRRSNRLGGYPQGNRLGFALFRGSELLECGALLQRPGHRSRLSQRLASGRRDPASDGIDFLFLARHSVTCRKNPRSIPV
jgi:hypothetical protein